MSQEVDPDFARGLEKFGVQSASTCFNCGNCTAACSLSSAGMPFPRKIIRYLQLGLHAKLRQSTEPWLCYYCGDCSETCPRGANPGEVMMGLRRYLTSQYDWTGISHLFYTSKAFELFSILLVALTVGLGFFLFHGPMLTDRVALNIFAPNHVIELLDLLMLGVLSLLLLSNAYRLFDGVMGEASSYPQPAEGEARGLRIRGVPVAFYLRELKEFAIHFFTQKQFKRCNTDSQRVQWFHHLLIMTGYCVVFLLVVVGLRWFQRDEIYPLWHPVRLLGYYATFAILYGSTLAIVGRLRRSKTVYAHSHSSDWAFLVLLWLTAFTGILVHTTRLLEMALPTYYLYVLHMMIAVPMLVIEVPFAKWTHQLYRPLALYLVKVRGRALEQ